MGGRDHCTGNIRQATGVARVRNRYPGVLNLLSNINYLPVNIVLFLHNAPLKVEVSRMHYAKLLCVVNWHINNQRKTSAGGQKMSPYPGIPGIVVIMSGLTYPPGGSDRLG